MEQYDFSGWATRANLKCSDGRVILKDAFKHCDGQKVPLCWGHQHDDPLRVLGHALLENREEGVYTYCKFNDTESGQAAKELVEHGDVCALSIYANQLKQNGPNVVHGAIREVSLVLAGANPGAYIDSIIKHGEESDEEAIIYTGEEIALAHSDESDESEDETEEETEEEVEETETEDESEDETEEETEEEETMAHSEEKTVADVINSMNDEQKNVMYALIAEALGENKNSDNSEGGNNTMKHNAFENDAQETKNVLSHADQQAIIAIVNIVLVLLMTTGSQRLYAQLSQPQYLERYETVNSEWIDENGKWLFAGVRIFCSVRIRAIWLGPFPAARRENICRTTSAASGSGSRWFSEVSDFR